MRRRKFIILLGGAVATWPFAVGAQPPPGMQRVGYVGIQPRDATLYLSFRRRMAELGYQEGRNFRFDYIQTPDIEGYERGYRELAARKVDIFLAVGGEPALRAAKAAAGMLPIAFLAIDFDPAAKGYVASMMRPGGNVSGIFVHQIELAAKRIELLREVFPSARRVGLLWDASSRDQAEAAAEAAKTLGFTPLLIEVTGEPPDYAAALHAMEDTPGQPVAIPAGPLFLRDRAVIAQALLDRRIPSISAFREVAEAGAMMSYGVDLMGLFRDIADYVDRIARGGKPAEMPIEQTTRFHMTVNLKTAASLNVSLSYAFTVRANEVFE
jgi:putative tryptophan/tyrosine transport system substrate-binding protein